MKYRFRPIEGLWRFHLIYMIVMLILGWSFSPYHLVYRSFLILSLFALIGLLAIRIKWHVVSHVFALVLGLSSPVVFFAQMIWWQVVILVGVLSFLAYLGREYLF